MGSILTDRTDSYPPLRAKQQLAGRNRHYALQQRLKVTRRPRSFNGYFEELAARKLHDLSGRVAFSGPERTRTVDSIQGEERLTDFFL